MTEESKRASTEYNAFEFLVAVLIDDNTINDYISLLQNINIYSSITKIKFNKPEEKYYYLDNLLKINKNKINKFIKNFRNNFYISYEEIITIYISGKKNYHDDIEELNKDIDRKSIKSDLYIKLINNEIIGYSIKQCDKSTKSNYSVHKLFKNKDLDHELTSIKSAYLIEHGFDRENKKDRSNINKLFYESNIYWDRLKEEILKHEELISNELCSYLYSSKITHYPVYEFDGNSMYKLNNKCEEIVSFKEHLPYYMKKNGEKRNTAKLFYQLQIGSKCYRVEIRWKGDVFSSPQYMIHEE